jgi:ADP-ribosyl-[dinitrogen reductase] hydrolase
VVDGVRFDEIKVSQLAKGDFVNKSKEEIRGSGYAVASLEAALWCFQHTDDFQAAILEAANLGDDADTTAAITGQLAGAYYGADQIPRSWLEKLYLRHDIEATADSLLRAAQSR